MNNHLGLFENKLNLEENASSFLMVFFPPNFENGLATPKEIVFNVLPFFSLSKVFDIVLLERCLGGSVV